MSSNILQFHDYEIQLEGFSILGVLKCQTSHAFLDQVWLTSLFNFLTPHSSHCRLLGRWFCVVIRKNK